MIILSEFKSVRKLRPLNKGGVISRGGFCFQDHVALNFCLEMASNLNLIEVWCETHDDITLIWLIDDKEEVEFVQVKDLDLDQLWSIAKLCQREDSKLSSSIFEKSLAEERCDETCRFRIVSSLGVKSELEILTLPFDTPYRKNNELLITTLSDQIEKKTGKVISPKGSSINDWVKRTMWQVEHSSKAITHKNINLISKTISAFGHDISIDTVELKIYPQLLDLVRKAAEIDPDVDPHGKRISKSDFTTKIKSMVDELLYDNKINVGKNIVRKMERARISDYIDTALTERRMYRVERLQPQYLQITDNDLIEGEVQSTLQKMRLELDSGNLEEGLPFYKGCLDKLDELRSSIATKTFVPSYYFHGCMHEITDRCAHRYHKEQA